MVRLMLAFAMLVGMTMAARADEADLKRQVDAIGAAYTEHFNKGNAAGLAALYTADGILVNPAGMNKVTPALFEGMFKNSGLNHLDPPKVEQVIMIDPKVALGIGTYHQTGKKADGTAVESEGWWSATYVLDGDKWKLRMLTAAPKPPPAK